MNIDKLIEEQKKRPAQMIDQEDIDWRKQLDESDRDLINNFHTKSVRRWPAPIRRRHV